TIPHNAAGMRIEPRVSLPSAPIHSPAASAAAEPPEDPPGERAVSQGFLHVPKCTLSLITPNAHSCILVLPTNTLPAARSLLTTMQSTRSTVSRRNFEPAVVATFASG